MKCIIPDSDFFTAFPFASLAVEFVEGSESDSCLRLRIVESRKRTPSEDDDDEM